MSLQKKTQGMAEEKISEVTGRMSAMAGGVTSKAGQSWDKLESIFEQRTAKAMHKLGVPTAKDVDALVERVDALAAAVAKLSKSAGPAPTAVGKKVAARRSRKKVAGKKSAAGKTAAEAAPEAAKPAARRTAARKSAVA
jgi:poly(hydroxyalkanoate) granule-associated protein